MTKVLVAVVDDITHFVTLELEREAVKRVLEMHGTRLRLCELEGYEQSVYNYFFTPHGKWRHKRTTRRAVGPFDHAIVVYYDRS
jgi:hypothetical protein